MSKQSRAFLRLLLVVVGAGCGGTVTSGDLVGPPPAGGASSSGSGTDPTAGDDDDGGVAPVDASIYETPIVCTSQQTWTHGDHGSSAMHPGLACVSCHETNDGPLLTVGGTVYPTAHEPDDCDGTNAGSMKVVITDANGTTTTLAVNAAGNFYGRPTIVPPYRAKVVAGTKVRAMSAKQTSGDCNACHTEKGAKDAPGRIMAP